MNYQVIEDFLVSENQSIKLLRSMFTKLRDFETHYDQQVYLLAFLFYSTSHCLTIGVCNGLLQCYHTKETSPRYFAILFENLQISGHYIEDYSGGSITYCENSK